MMKDSDEQVNQVLMTLRLNLNPPWLGISGILICTCRSFVESISCAQWNVFKPTPGFGSTNEHGS